MLDLKKLEVWFITGSQSLYGEETLNQVALIRNESFKIECLRILFRPR